MKSAPQRLDKFEHLMCVRNQVTRSKSSALLEFRRARIEKTRTRACSRLQASPHVIHHERRCGAKVHAVAIKLANLPKFQANFRSWSLIKKVAVEFVGRLCRLLCAPKSKVLLGRLAAWQTFATRRRLPSKKRARGGELARTRAQHTPKRFRNRRQSFARCSLRPVCVSNLRV